MVFPLHQVPSVSGCYSHCDNQISFAVAVVVVYGSSLPLPPTHRCDSFLAGCFTLPVAIGYPFLSPLSPPFVIVG